MGKLETSRKGIEGLKAEHDEDLIDDTMQEQEELTFDKIMQKLSKSDEEILKEDAARLKKEAKELEESIKIKDAHKEEVQALRDSIEDIFG